MSSLTRVRELVVRVTASWQRPSGGRLDGKVALVTGAARGQGLTEALAMAGEGAELILIDSCTPIPGIKYEMPTPEDLERAAEAVAALGVNCTYAVADVRQADGLAEVVTAAVAVHGRLDIVVANAGVLHSPRPLWELSATEWDSVIGVNLTGVWATLRAAVPHIIGGEAGGSVILISSIAGDRGCPNVAPYVAAKHGVVGLMRTAANELAQFSIRVNSIHPTNVRTPMIDNPVSARIFRSDLDEPVLDDGVESLRRVNLMNVPWITSEDVAQAVLFLASDDSRYITGAMLPVDAGALAKWPG